MRRNPSLAALLLPLALAACGTPQEQCIARTGSEARAVARLLAETEANLARGYAWDERPVEFVEWRDCRDIVRDRDGTARAVLRPCLRETTEWERFRVAIDPAAETRKRDNLRARLKALTPAAEAAARACRAAYPEG